MPRVQNRGEGRLPNPVGTSYNIYPPKFSMRIQYISQDSPELKNSLETGRFIWSFIHFLHTRAPISLNGPTYRRKARSTTELLKTI